MPAPVKPMAVGGFPLWPGTQRTAIWPFFVLTMDEEMGNKEEVLQGRQLGRLPLAPVLTITGMLLVLLLVTVVTVDTLGKASELIIDAGRKLDNIPIVEHVEGGTRGF